MTEVSKNTPLGHMNPKSSTDQKPKLTKQTCTSRPTPLCPYCGCKNNNALGFFHATKTTKNLSLCCTCCKMIFKFDKEVSITFTSSPNEGWGS